MTYVAILVIVLAVVAGVTIYRNRKNQKRLSRLGAFAFLLVLFGIFFGENKLVGYSFIGLGLVVCLIDTIKGLKNK